jgi:hypothetical protein
LYPISKKLQRDPYSTDLYYNHDKILTMKFLPNVEYFFIIGLR